MAYCEYKVRKNGIISKGYEEGHLGDIRRKLINNGFIIISLKEIKSKDKKAAGLKASGILKALISMFNFSGTIKSSKLAQFCSELSILLEAGMTIPESIRLMTRNEKDKSFKLVLEAIENEINQGISLSESIKNRRGKFPRIFEMLIRTGEFSGDVSTVLKEMADHFEKIDENKAKIISVSIYPLILSVFLVLNLIVMSIKVIPVFRELFKGIENELPLMTRLIFTIADFIKENYLLLAIGVLLILFFIISGVRNSAVRPLLDEVVLRIPVFKKLVIDSSVNRFLKNMALLLKNGMTIIEALEPSISTVGNHVIRDSIRNDTKAIIEGKPLHDLLRNNKYISDIAKTLIETGENTAKIEATLGKAIYYYNRDIDKRIDRINRLMEPVILLIFGLIIGIVVISLAIPIFKISSGSLIS